MKSQRSNRVVTIDEEPDAEFYSFVRENDDVVPERLMDDDNEEEFFKKLSLQFYSLKPQTQVQIAKKQPKSVAESNFYNIHMCATTKQWTNIPVLSVSRDRTYVSGNRLGRGRPSQKDSATTAASLQKSDRSSGKVSIQRVGESSYFETEPPEQRHRILNVKLRPHQQPVEYFNPYMQTIGPSSSKVILKRSILEPDSSGKSKNLNSPYRDELIQRATNSNQKNTLLRPKVDIRIKRHKM